MGDENACRISVGRSKSSSSSSSFDDDNDQVILFERLVGEERRRAAQQISGKWTRREGVKDASDIGVLVAQ